MLLQEGRGAVDRLGLVHRRKGKPQPGRARRDRRRPDRDDQQAVPLQHRRGRQRPLGLADDHRHDRALRRLATQRRRESPGVLERPARSSGSSRMIRSAAAAAATDAGGRPVENIRLRARFSSNAISSDEPQTYPPQLPAAFESVPICTSAGCAGQTPRPWASSVISQASCARGQLAQLGDRPEVAVHAEDRLGQDQAASERARWASSSSRQ